MWHVCGMYVLRVGMCYECVISVVVSSYSVLCVYVVCVLCVYVCIACVLYVWCMCVVCLGCVVYM